MPLIDTHKSLVAGHPQIIRREGQLQVIQRRLLGLAFMVMAALIPGGILVGEITKGRIRSSAQLIEKILQLNTVWLIGGIIVGLFLVAIFLWGFFWLFWTRKLVIDLTHRRYTFVTGLGPWKNRQVGNCDDPVKIRLLRKEYVQDSAQSTGMCGPCMESWQLSLEFPDVKEPLYLGEWGKLDEVMVEVDSWQEIFTCSNIEK